MTTKRRGLLAASTLGLALACVAGLGLRGRGAPSNTRGAPPTVRPAGGLPAADDRAAYDPEQVNKTVAFWEARAVRDPQGALERNELAGAYLARHRETGDIADAVRAEDAARQSLKILRRNNAGALTRLARSLLAQHRFPEALELAAFAATFDPENNRLVADVRMELGDYDEAARALADAPSEADDPNHDALEARLEAVNGRPEAALRLLRRALRRADERPDMPAETVAWYHAMVGHALTDSGELAGAERAFRDALKVFPRDYRAMTGLAEVAAWRGDWRGAVDWGKKAVAVAPQNPEALKVIGDACAALGQGAEAECHYKLLEELARSFPRIYDRHWAMFCADSGRDLDAALALARKDLELRRDVHAYDTLAWVSFKKGLLPEAEAAVRKALGRGTREATLLYHAGMIARAGGDTARARDLFTRARAINPHAIPLRWLRWADAEGDAPR